MSIFRKKEEEEMEEPSDKGGVNRRYPKNKAFKDLRSENKERRKEPAKPWGKKERLFVLIILLFTIGVSGILSLSARSWKLPGLPRLKLPSFSLPFIGEETIILEGRKDKDKEREKAEEVIRKFKALTDDLSGIYGLYVIRLKDGSSYGLNEKENFQAASLVKLPVMIAMYNEAEKGNLNLDAKYKLKNSDKVGGAGSLQARPEGYTLTYREMLRLMAKQSENTAFAVARKTLGDEKINEVMKSLGMRKTSLEKNETTPYDIGTLLEGLWRGNIVSQKSRDEVLENLTDTIYENWLVAGVPEGVRVAHKYGREVHVVNDAGIVFTPKEYIVVIMTKGVVEREADDIFPKLSQLIYQSESE